MLRLLEGMTNGLVEHTLPSICEDVLHNHVGYAPRVCWLDLRILQRISQIMMLKCLLYMIYHISFQMP